MIEVKTSWSQNICSIDITMEGTLRDYVADAAGTLRAMHDNILKDLGPSFSEKFRTTLLNGLNKEAFWHDPEMIQESSEDGVLS